MAPLIGLYEPHLAYDDALALQADAAREGRAGWLLFSCLPTITLGRRALESDLLVARAALQARGVRVLDVDRGGEVTYHGPEQIIGFPFGRLKDHAGDPRAVRTFVDAMKRSLARVVEAHGHRVDRANDGAGLWVCAGAQSSGIATTSKIASIGLAFARDGIRHGFALNVQPVAARFALIHPCGARDGAPVASVFAESKPRRAQDDVARGLVDILCSGR